MGNARRPSRLPPRPPAPPWGGLADARTRTRPPAIPLAPHDTETQDSVIPQRPPERAPAVTGLWGRQASLLALLPAGVVHGVVAVLGGVVAAGVQRAVGVEGRAGWAHGRSQGTLPPANVCRAAATGGHCARPGANGNKVC